MVQSVSEKLPTTLLKAVTGTGIIVWILRRASHKSCCKLASDEKEMLWKHTTMMLLVLDLGIYETHINLGARFLWEYLFIRILRIDLLKFKNNWRIMLTLKLLKV